MMRKSERDEWVEKVAQQPPPNPLAVTTRRRVMNIAHDVVNGVEIDTYAVFYDTTHYTAGVQGHSTSDSFPHPDPEYHVWWDDMHVLATYDMKEAFRKHEYLMYQEGYIPPDEPPIPPVPNSYFEITDAVKCIMCGKEIQHPGYHRECYFCGDNCRKLWEYSFDKLTKNALMHGHDVTKYWD